MKDKINHLKDIIIKIKIPFMFGVLMASFSLIMIFFGIDLRIAYGLPGFIFVAFIFYLFFDNTNKINDINSISINVLFFVVFGSPILIYSISLLMSFFASLCNLPRTANGETWITFAGSILGGAMTLLAVIFTLNSEREKSKKDKTISLLPVIEINQMLYDNELISKLPHSDYQKYSNNKYHAKPDCIITGSYRIKNMSNNIIRELKIVGFIIHFKNTPLTIPTDKFKSINIILPFSEVVFDIDIDYLCTFLINQLNNDVTKILFDAKLEISFEYYDLHRNYNANPYKHIFTSMLTIDCYDKVIISKNECTNEFDLNILDRIIQE